MIVKIFSPRENFHAVRYNTDKIERNKGELMRIRNFGILENGFDLKPQDVKNYLAAFSLSNPRVTKPQFHATISCKGRESDKEELSELAEKWMEKMGFGENPYLVVFHSDTPNNHVHIVSTRVGLDGKKISDQFEKRRAQQHLKDLLGQRKELPLAQVLSQLEGYQYNTLAQFRLLLEQAGWHPRIRDNYLDVYREGELQKSYSLEDLKGRMEQAARNDTRLLKLKAILHKYHLVTDRNLIPEYRVLPGGRQGELSGYHSALTRMMHQKFGLDFIFHFKGEKLPYGYTVIDHVGKQVYKGSELMKLAQLSDSDLQTPNRSAKFSDLSRSVSDWRVSSEQAANALANYLDVQSDALSPNFKPLTKREQSDYRTLLRYLLNQRGTFGLKEQGLVILKDGTCSYLLDKNRLLISELDEIIALKEDLEVERYQSRLSDQFPSYGLGITADQDDELVYGRRRRNKNSRK